MKNIYWIDINRFDEKIDKSTWLEISESLISESFSVTLLTGFKNEKYIPDGYRITIRYFNAINRKGLFKPSLLFEILRWGLKSLHKSDIVIVSPGSLCIGVVFKLIKKCIIHLDIRTLPVEVKGIKKKLENLFFWQLPIKYLAGFAKSRSFITELLKNNVEKEFNTTYKNYVLWHSGVNIDHYAPVRQHEKNDDNEFVLTYLGVVTRSRGLDRVLRALSKIKKDIKNQLKFQVIGDGPFLPELKQMSSSLNLHGIVIYRGYVPYESVPRHIMNTDCFICPLPDRMEWNVSSPIKVFEYLACARPMILTPIISHKNIVQNNEFVVWSAGDKVQDFVEAIEYALKNRKALMSKSKSAPAFIPKIYEWKEQGKRFRQYLEITHHQSTSGH